MAKKQPAAEPVEEQGEGELLSDEEAAEFGLDERGLTPEQAEQERKDAMQRLDNFGQSLAKTRAEAISARQSSGIEDDWIEDEEFYQGIDDANRSEFKSATWRTKPPGKTSGDSKQTTRSTVFPNITRPYCDMAASRIADMLMPTDDRPFKVERTPVPDLLELSKGKPSLAIQRQVKAEAQGMMPNQDDAAATLMASHIQKAKELIEEADAKANLAQERIDDWLTECSYQGENRRAIEDASKVGTGVLKGPFPETKRVTVYKDGALHIEEKTVPVSKRIDYWNFFPSADCGENIHNGSCVWERDYLTKKKLRDLLKADGYIKEQIELCLQEGPQKATAEYKPTPDMTEQDNKGQYEIWYYHGTAEREDMVAAGVEFDDDDIDPHMPAMIVMVNNHVIKAALNPVDTGEFPYDVMVWQRRAGYCAGIGVARQIRTPQRMVIAGTRNLMDNAGLAAGPMLVFLQGVVSMDGVLGLGPRKVFMVGEDAEAITDARFAVGSIKVDMLVNELMEIINLGLRFAEDVTGMPMIMQGQLGKAPDTVGGMEMLFNAASSVLRRLARLYDDLITVPHIGRYYHWLLQHGEDEEKGDYCINARGSSALVERSIQSQELAIILQFAGNPTFGIDPRKAMEQYLKSRHFTPSEFTFDDEQCAQIVQNLAQPQQQDTSVEVATLKAEVDREKIASNERIAQFEAEFESIQNNAIKEFESQMESMRQAGAKDLSLDRMQEAAAKMKTDMARDVLKLRTQLRMANQKAVQVATPAMEPPQRAAPGRAFQE